MKASLRATSGTLLLAAAVAALHLSALPASGQEVRGRFVVEGSGEPLAGGYVALLDAGGRAVATTLTNATGWFSLGAPSAGRYTVEAEHIGYERARRAVEVATGEPAWVELAAAFRAIELEGITAEVDRECSVPEETARRVATLWEELRKAFRVTAYVEERGTFLFDVERWTRRLEPRRLRVEEESREPRSGFHRGSPFRSLAPERLADEGYVHGEAGSEELAYYAPDSRVLLSRSFQETHCFGFQDDGPEEGWVGVQFQPRDSRARDIEGTVWVDGDTYEPQRVDFRYSLLPWSELHTDKVGGRIDFTRIPEGPWIIRRWHIRMPLVERREFRAPGGGLEVRYGLAGVLEQGGEVLRARSGERTAFAAEPGSVEGVVLDSLSNRPVEGATVRLEGTFLEATADAEGRFALSQVPEGVYRAVAVSPRLAALGLPGAGKDVTVRPGRSADVELRVPSAGLALQAECRWFLGEEGTAVLTGRVLSDGRELPPDVEVAVSWTGGELRGRTNVVGERRGEVSVTSSVAAVPVEADGRWRLCGVPSDEAFRVWARRGDVEGRKTRIDPLEEYAVREVDLSLPSSTVAALVVRVVDQGSGDPLDGVRVTLDGGRSAATDATGSATFVQAAAGTRALTVERLGYATREEELELEPGEPVTVRVPMATEAIELEAIEVVVRSEAEEAERRRATSATVAVDAAGIRELVTSGRADDVSEVVRDLLPASVRVSPMTSRDNSIGTCIESTRAVRIRGDARECRMVAVIVDGGLLLPEDAARFVESFPLSEIESLEFLSPTDATFQLGTRYGNGALVIRTRR